MIVKAIKFKKKYIVIITITLSVILTTLVMSFFIYRSFLKDFNIKEKDEIEENEKTEQIQEMNYINEIQENVKEKEYIKWVDYNVPLEIMEKTAKLDINSHIKEETIKLNWIELISCLATKYGGNFKSFKQSDLDNIVEKLKKGEKIEDIITNHKLYSYYIEAYTAILDEFIGEYEIEEYENEEKVLKRKYGIKAFLPIAKNYGFSHYDDFGNSRSYGYKRVHLGNDLMGSIGTPIIAVESGVVEACRLEPIWRLESRNKKF